LKSGPLRRRSLTKSYIYPVRKNSPPEFSNGVYSDTGRILCQRDGGQSATEYFYVTDRLGSVRQVVGIVDNEPAIVLSYTYSPFGQMLEQSKKTGFEYSFNSFLFTGQWFDSEFGQYYLRARQYDPVLMRFTARDPVRGKFQNPLTLHPYMYCINGPINKIDLSGNLSVPLSPITTGHILHTHSINLACYATDLGDWRFFDLAEFTVRFTPVAMSIAFIASYIPDFKYTYPVIVVYNTMTDPSAAGLGVSGLFMNPWAVSGYALGFWTVAERIGVGSGDVDDFLEWKGGFFADIENMYRGTGQVWDFAQLDEVWDSVVETWD